MAEIVAIILMASSGFMSADIRQISQLPFQNMTACETFAKSMTITSSTNFAVICISTATGANVMFKGARG